uniref:hypothetical protein n=1 Tax=Kroppenstedtia sanguinis TaxID=1380684 RepID=UPI003D1A3BD5
MQRIGVCAILLFFFFFVSMSGLSAAESEDSRLSIHTEHQVLIAPQKEEKWIGVLEREVLGVQVRAKLVTDGKAQGIWKFSYAYPEKVRLSEGSVKTVVRRGNLESKTGSVQLPITRPNPYRITVRFEGLVDGKPVTTSQFYSFDIPRIQQKADKLGKDDSTVVQAQMTGRKVEGHWMMAVARPDSEILYVHEGKKPRLQVQLPPGEYILKTVFYGNVDGLRMGMQESKTLKVKEKDSSTYVIPGKNNELRTYDQAIRAIKGMHQSGRLAESDQTYSVKAKAYSGGVSVLLVLLGLMVYRKKKMS